MNIIVIYDLANSNHDEIYHDCEIDRIERNENIYLSEEIGSVIVVDPDDQEIDSDDERKGDPVQGNHPVTPSVGLSSRKDSRE